MSTWVRAEKIVWDDFEGEVVLVQPDKGQVWVLNASGSFVWKACDGRTPLATIADGMARGGGGSERDVAGVLSETGAFCEDMKAQGLLAPAATAAPPEVVRPRPRFQAPYVPPTIKKKDRTAPSPGRPRPRSGSGLP